VLGGEDRGGLLLGDQPVGRPSPQLGCQRVDLGQLDGLEHNLALLALLGQCLQLADRVLVAGAAGAQGEGAFSDPVNDRLQPPSLPGRSFP
jgi:hypothetical protein